MRRFCWHKDTHTRWITKCSFEYNPQKTNFSVASLYRVLLFGPVQPVFPLRVILGAFPAVFDGKLKNQVMYSCLYYSSNSNKSAYFHSKYYKLSHMIGDGGWLTPMHLQTSNRMFPWGGFLLYSPQPAMNTTTQDGWRVRLDSEERRKQFTREMVWPLCNCFICLIPRVSTCFHQLSLIYQRIQMRQRTDKSVDFHWLVKRFQAINANML